MTGFAKGTVIKLLSELGEACATYHDEHVRGVATKRMAAVALHFMYYNFCRVHKTLRVTPAMEAGISNRVWEIEELVDLMRPKSILEGLKQAI
jgi:hypothetical protein